MVLSADGCVESAIVPTTDCCPPPLCGNDLCGMFCAFIDMLPSGPMWDYWKRKATSYFTEGDNASECNPVVDPDCPSLVQHSIYTVLKLRDIVHNALWPALRESNPYSAQETLDDWLARLQWEDCYNQHCRSVLLGDLTPYEIQGPCGPIFCPPDIPQELIDAVKRATVIALTRAQMGVIKNLCGLNWIIEPLGAEIRPVNPVVTPINPDPCVSKCPDNIQFEICHTSDTLPGLYDPEQEVCESRRDRPEIPAVWTRDECDTPAGLPAEIWPGVLVAECIVRSLMPRTCPNNITRCC